MLFSPDMLLFTLCLLLSSKTVIANVTQYSGGSRFSVRIVGIFVAGSELPYTLELAQPAVEIAVEKARLFYPSIAWEKPEFRNGSSKCTSNYAGVFAAEEYYERRVTAFVGPACGLALDPVARMAAHWNIPVFTSGGLQGLFSEKTIFSTLTRLSVSLEKMGIFLREILKRFSWKHVAIVVHETYEIIPLIRRSIEQALDQEDISFDVHEMRRSLNKVNLTALLIECSKEARVFIILSSGETVRKLLLAAHDLRMGSGEYVFIGVQLFRSTRSVGSFGWFEDKGLRDHRNEDAKAIYQSLLIVSVRVPVTQEYDAFVHEVVQRSKMHFNQSFEEEAVNAIVTGFHDSVLLYGQALKETLDEEGDPLDGFSVSRRLWNRTFHGYLSDDIVYINENGDKETDFILSDLDPDTLEMKTVFVFYGHLPEDKALQAVRDVHWAGGRRSPPSDVPECGFSGDYPSCLSNNEGTTFMVSFFVVLIFLSAICFTVGLSIYRKLRLESDLASHWWRVNFEEILVIDGSERSFDAREDSGRSPLYPGREPQTSQFHTLLTVAGAPSSAHCSTHLSAKKGLYKGAKVAVKPLNLRRVSLNRNVLLELKQMRDLCHENLIRFIGVCPEEGNTAILTEYSQKGNLRELLDNEAFNIDWPFRFSLISDIIEGMNFIHESPIEYHGRLKSTNCVIDRRLVVKLTDYGLRSLMSQTLPEADVDPKMLLWTAPELLKQKRPEIHGSKRGDVFSFAIVVQEIVTRTGPYETPRSEDGSSASSPYDPGAILARIRSGGDPVLRPEIPEEECPLVIIQMMKDCWDEMPGNRPSFDSIRQQLKKVTKELGSGNFLENLLLRMEQYANDLEKLVEQKTAAFFEEKRKCEDLLYEVLPRYVAEQLKCGNHVRPETFECVTIYFSDIVDFATLSFESTPIQIVELLNDLYSCFDAIIAHYDVYKVETIGDAYMVVSGLPTRNGNEHVREVARMSLALLEAIKKFRVKHMPERLLKLRIGIHSGQCAAGVVGLKMPRYCLFGDTVNTASRMESHGEAMKIHVSQETKTLLDKFSTFKLSCRGSILIKGKGIITTYWLEREEYNGEQRKLSF